MVDLSEIEAEPSAIQFIRLQQSAEPRSVLKPAGVVESDILAGLRTSSQRATRELVGFDLRGASLGAFEEEVEFVRHTWDMLRRT